MGGRRSLRTALGFGAVILGPGLLSGREIWEFYLRRGDGGLEAVLLTAALYAGGGVLLLLWPRVGPATLFEAVAQQAGKGTAVLLAVAARAALILNLAVVLATGAELGKIWGMPAAAAIPLLALLLLLLRSQGIRGLLRLGAVVLPAAMVLVGVVAWKGRTLPPGGTGGATVHGPLRTVLYVGYNLILAMPLLYVMGRREEAVTAWTGGVLGGAGLGMMTGLLLASIRRSGAGTCGLPMVCAVDRICPWARIPFLGLLTLLLLLSGLSILLSLDGLEAHGSTAAMAGSLWALLLAWALTPLGLGGMMNLLYPVFGAAGVMAVLLALEAWRGGGAPGARG